MTGFIPDDAVTDHAFVISGDNWSQSCQYLYPRAVAILGASRDVVCGRQRMEHVNPGDALTDSLLVKRPHAYQNNNPADLGHCTFTVDEGLPRVCGYPKAEHEGVRRLLPVRVADVAQYPREPMPDGARGKIAVTLIDSPVDPLGTLAVISGIYKGKVYRAKSEVTDDDRRAAWAAMRKTVLSGPLESMQFTFLIEGCDRALTHQIVRSRFSFFAQESLRFAVAEDWPAEVALPPSLLGRPDDDALVSVWRRGLNAAEDAYSALVAAGLPAEEARGLLPHAIPTRLFWTMSLRTLLLEAGKRTCTQAQFPWRVLFAGIAQALRARATEGENVWQPDGSLVLETFLDNWQYELFAEAIEPVCYQTGKCGFKAEFDRACSIRERVDAFEKAGVPSSEWHRGYAGKGLFEFEGQDAEGIPPINRSEWLTDPSAARVTEA